MIDALFLVLVTASALLFTAGDALLKHWAGSPKQYIMLAGLLLYVAAGLFLAISFKRREFAAAVAVLNCINLIAVVIIGVFVFKEALTFKTAIGMVLAMAAIVILSV